MTRSTCRARRTSVLNRAVRQARHSQNAWARHVERVVFVSRRDIRDEPSGIWSLLMCVGIQIHEAACGGSLRARARWQWRGESSGRMAFCDEARQTAASTASCLMLPHCCTAGRRLPGCIPYTVSPSSTGASIGGWGVRTPPEIWPGGSVSELTTLRLL